MISSGREIISNLAKAAGLATMIATMRPDIDNLDEYVRNTTARAFAVVASALGIPALLPFLKAVCQSRKSWQARHTGIKIVMQVRQPAELALMLQCDDIILIYRCCYVCAYSSNVCANLTVCCLDFFPWSVVRNLPHRLMKSRPWGRAKRVRRSPGP